MLPLLGFAGSPAEMRGLGNYLFGRGLSVHCALLPGHASSVEDLKRSTVAYWTLTADRECRDYRLAVRQSTLLTLNGGCTCRSRGSGSAGG